MRVLAFMGVVIAFLVPPLYAQTEPIAADRPGFADGPGIVDARHVQVELGLALEENDGSSLSIPTLVRLGLTEALELRFESDVVGISDGERDLAPFAAGMKLRLREGSVPLSLIASVQPPSGGGALRTNDFEGEVRLTSDLDLGGGFSLTPNIGASLAEGVPLNAVVAASIGTECGNLLPFVDFEYRDNDGEASAIADAGVAWIVHNDVQLDISGGVRVTGDGYGDWFISAGVSRRFPFRAFSRK